MTCAGCVHAKVKTHISRQLVFCTRYKIPATKRCIDFRERPKQK